MSTTVYVLENMLSKNKVGGPTYFQGDIEGAKRGIFTETHELSNATTFQLLHDARRTMKALDRYFTPVKCEHTISLSKQS